MKFKKIEVYDYPSGMGGNFTVYKKSNNIAVIVYGKKEHYGWDSFGDFDGREFIIEPKNLSNKRVIDIPKNHGEFPKC